MALALARRSRISYAMVSHVPAAARAPYRAQTVVQLAAWMATSAWVEIPALQPPWRAVSMARPPVQSRGGAGCCVGTSARLCVANLAACSAAFIPCNSRTECSGGQFCCLEGTNIDTSWAITCNTESHCLDGPTTLATTFVIPTAPPIAHPVRLARNPINTRLHSWRLHLPVGTTSCQGDDIFTVALVPGVPLPGSTSPRSLRSTATPPDGRLFRPREDPTPTTRSRHGPYPITAQNRPECAIWHECHREVSIRAIGNTTRRLARRRWHLGVRFLRPDAVPRPSSWSIHQNSGTKLCQPLCGGVMVVVSIAKFGVRRAKPNFAHLVLVSPCRML